MSEVKTESKALQMFVSAIKSESTLQTYIKYLNYYLKYSGKTDYDQLVQDSNEEIQKSLENYVLELTRIHSRSFINVQYNALFLFFSMNDKTLNITKIRKMFPEQVEKVGGDAYTNDEVKKIITNAEPPRNKSQKKLRNIAILHILASTGCRVGVIENLSLKDFTKIEDCYAMVCYSNTPKYSYTTFLTPEASESFDNFVNSLEKKLRKTIRDKYPDKVEIFKDGVLTHKDFRDYAIFGLSTFGVERLVNRIVNRAGVRVANTLTNYKVPTVHGFRKRWATIMKGISGINQGYIEMMMGHSLTINLDSAYSKPSIEKLFHEYKKGIKALTVFQEKT